MGGALALRLAADHPDRVAGVVVVNPAVATKRKDVKLLPVLKHVVPSFPGIANDIKKPGVDEHGYTTTPLKAAHSMMRAWKPLIAPTSPEVTAPLLYFRSAEDHVVDDASQPHHHRPGLLARRHRAARSTDSYHVATLDNDAEQIFEESAEFVARVTRVTSNP